MSTVISVENLSKSYQLGQIGTGTFAHDLVVWVARMRGKPNPILKIGQDDHGNHQGEEIWALKDVSFTVQQGEVLGIIGRNGAGKSTLLKILSRVTAPSSGKIKVKGRIASLLEVGTGFHPELTGRENVYLNGAILGMSRGEIDRKFDEIVDFSGVEKFIDTPVKRYSSGMYVRLAFAVAAHLEPEILVVDEVLAVGDAEFQKKCLGKMGDVAQEGRTVLFVSHNMGAITQICSKGLLLVKGSVDEINTPEETIQKYLFKGVDSGTDIRFETKQKAEKIANIKRLWLGDEEGVPISVANTSQPFSIGVEFDIAQVVKNFEIYLRIYNEVGNPLFTSKTSDLSEGKLPDLDIGSYKFINVIPTPFFASGNYSAMIAIGQPLGETVDKHDHALTFTVQETGSHSWMYSGNKKHGNILVQFPWKQMDLD
jgi:lipopolysaccharide transport system ATP-binding protein